MSRYNIQKDKRTNIKRLIGVVNMTKDFSKTSLEYNEGFIDGLLWVLNSGNKTGLNEIISVVDEIRKANDKKLDDDEKRFEQLKINLESK